jgi:hypothetical protein
VIDPQGVEGFEQQITVRNLVAIFLLIVSAFGAVGGAAIGYGLDGIVPDRRLLALLAAFFAVALVIVFRRVLGRSYPPLRIKFPLVGWLTICFSTLIGGLAGHDLTQLFGLTRGIVTGFTSGTLASISMAMLMIVYFYEHPEKGVEF